MKKLLVIFAHPDDESFGPAAGTLAKYAAQGVRVHYICATRGEAGEYDPDILGNHPDLAHARTAELFEAAHTMGFAGVYFLGYLDSGMEGSPSNANPRSLYSAPLEEVAQRLATYIRCVNPDAIITHDEYGWYGHPDHIKCYQATLRAYELLYDVKIGTEALDEQASETQIPTLYAASFPKWPIKLAARFLSLTGRNPRKRGQNGDIDLVEIASWEVPTTTRIQVGDYLAIKQRAIACHRSQRPLTATGNPISRAFLRRIEQQETLYKLYPLTSKRARLETRIF
ncbi:MAG: PIG-L family deacetylase [Anaerolineae bacterium]|nr:PIG-L family deacetylase [Anaerolineae bacterium]